MRTLLCILVTLFICFSCRHKSTNLKASRDTIKNNLKDLSIANQDTVLIITEENEVKEFCFTELDEKPQFQSGDDDIRKYLLGNLHYPEIAIDSNIEGRVFVRFVVMKNGSVEDIKIIKGVSKEIDSICVAVFENMPKWKPGKIKDEKVNVQFIIPIVFQLVDDYDNKTSYANTKQVNEEQKITAKIYPNPCSEFFKVEISSQFTEVNFQITNLKGQIVKAGSIYSENDQININELNNGMYLVKFTSKELGLNTTGKLIIKK